MEKQSSNQVLIKDSSLVPDTYRNLIIQSEELNYYLKGYEQWLRVLGYTKSTVSYFPVYLRSFFCFLEKHGIKRLMKLRSAHIMQSVISYWLTKHNLRTVQFMAGHRYVSSTEWYKRIDIQELRREVSLYHPLKREYSNLNW